MRRRLGPILAVLLLATPLALIGSDPVSAAPNDEAAVELEGDTYMAQSSGGGFWQTVRKWVCHPVAQLVTAAGSAALSAAAITSAAASGAGTAAVVIVLVCNWEYFREWFSWPTQDGTPEGKPIVFPMA